MSTFIDFEMSEYDKTIKKRFNNYKNVVSDPLGSILATIGTDMDSEDNKLKYLFSLLKIFIIENDEEKSHRVYSFIGDYLNKNTLSDEVKSKFTLSLKNYRNL